MSAKRQCAECASPPTRPVTAPAAEPACSPSPTRWKRDCYNLSQARSAELIVACGDLPAEYLRALMNALDVPLVFVPGNHDPDQSGYRVFRAGFPRSHVENDFQRGPPPPGVVPAREPAPS